MAWRKIERRNESRAGASANTASDRVSGAFLSIPEACCALSFATLLVFTPKPAQAKRTGLREYGMLAERYLHEFDSKWLGAARLPVRRW
jgi:hypothetical protein